ncbi:hypothetical protein POL68_26785 [Stigmatella sp. ncwal1]|uniref:Lipoprotein n=1 Tax=Stigmatella ashevillensis TaxID=2995309 RepID=A0ABT5DF32_9BACT|nr:hypothetical protein [Stigmatella ashevillena]MDC0712101.1 hypothetical protein [Stigmatella ashevillena]
MQNKLSSVWGRALLQSTLVWAMACGGQPPLPEEEGLEITAAVEPTQESFESEDSFSEDPSQQLADACSGATGTGTYKGYMCPSHLFITTKSISCAAARSNCILNANSNPGTSFFCTWNDRVIYRKDVTAGACNPLVCSAVTGKGQYKGYICPSHNFITTEQISCQDAQSNCALNSNANPSSSFYCTWKGTEIYRRETVAGICGP